MRLRKATRVENNNLNLGVTQKKFFFSWSHFIVVYKRDPIIALSLPYTTLENFINMISSSSISSPVVKTTCVQDQYTPIPHFPACLGGEWKNLVKTPYLKTTMKFRAGASLVS